MLLISQVTAGAFQTKPPARDSFGSARYAFLTEISSTGDRLLYSTYFGADAVSCAGGSSCIGLFGNTSATSLALDPSGSIWMAGLTNAHELPVTPGVLAATCLCNATSSVGFIARFSAGATKSLQWSTFLNPTQTRQFQPAVQIHALALDPAGNVIVAGGAPSTFPATPGVVQPTPPGGGIRGGFIAKLNNSGSALIWSTYFGNVAVSALAADPQGRILVTGYSDANLLPSVPGMPLTGSRYVARLSGDGRVIQDLFVGPEFSTGKKLILTPTGTFVAMGQLGSLWIETLSAGPSILAKTSAATGWLSGGVAPHELISLHGMGIGPPTPLDGQVVNAAFTTSLGGYQVLFDGIAAPLLHAGPTQIRTIVPQAVLRRDSTRIQIATPSGNIDGPTLAVRVAAPEIFRSSDAGLAAALRLSVALNQNGSLNSLQNPAKPGEVVTIFATGAGATSWSDGSIVPPDLFRGTSLPVAVLASVFLGPHSTGGLTSLEVLYAGDAPGLVAGVMQINFRLPDRLPPGSTLDFRLLVGDALGGQGAISISP